MAQSIDLLFGEDLQWNQDSDGVNPFAQWDLEHVLRTPRAVKVLQDIQKLPPGDCRAACRNLFARAFQAQTNFFDRFIRRLDDPTIPQKNLPVHCSSLTLALAMFATADSGQRDLLADQFAQLDRYVDEGKSRLGSRQTEKARLFLQMFPWWIFPVPDNRFQVNVLRLAALRERSGKLLSLVDAECDRLGMEKTEMPVERWEAVTGFENRTQRDSSNAMTNYIFYYSHDFDLDMGHNITGGQEALIRKLRFIVFPLQRY